MNAEYWVYSTGLDNVGWFDPTYAMGGVAYGTYRWYKTGYELTRGKDFRFAPFGNRTGHKYGKWPHYHRRVVNPRNPSQSLPGQGIGRHRPWQPSPVDKTFWDRF